MRVGVQVTPPGVGPRRQGVGDGTGIVGVQRPKPATSPGESDRPSQLARGMVRFMVPEAKKGPGVAEVSASPNPRGRASAPASARLPGPPRGPGLAIAPSLSKGPGLASAPRLSEVPGTGESTKYPEGTGRRVHRGCHGTGAGENAETAECTGPSGQVEHPAGWCQPESRRPGRGSPGESQRRTYRRRCRALRGSVSLRSFRVSRAR